MEAISLKLPEGLLEAAGRCASKLKLTRAEYIRTAIERVLDEVHPSTMITNA